jgi:hypothetical protein
MELAQSLYVILVNIFARTVAESYTLAKRIPTPRYPPPFLKYLPTHYNPLRAITRCLYKKGRYGRNNWGLFSRRQWQTTPEKQILTCCLYIICSHSFYLMYIWLCSCLTNVFLLLCLIVRSIVYLCIYCMFIYSLYVYVSLRLPLLRFFLVFSWVVRQMPG